MISGVSVARIRKPVQIKEKTLTIDAYHSLNQLLQRFIHSAMQSKTDVMQYYSQPLDYTLYENNKNESISNSERDEESMIDWTSLINDASNERFDTNASKRNDRRFEQTIEQFQKSCQKYRKSELRNIFELDGAWQKYFLEVGDTHDLSPKLSAMDRISRSRTFNMNFNINISQLNINSDGNNNNNNVRIDGDHKIHQSYFSESAVDEKNQNADDEKIRSMGDRFLSPSMAKHISVYNKRFSII